MEFLRLIHDFQIVGFPLPLFPTPFALLTLVLFVWSLGVAWTGRVTPGFLAWLRLTWMSAAAKPNTVFLSTPPRKACTCSTRVSRC